jgi:hypothetical protein
VVVVVQG